MKKLIVIIAAILIFASVGIVAVTHAPTKQDSKQTTPSAAVSQVPAQTKADTFSYEGKAGQDALRLMKEKTSVEQNASGLVISINGRRADEKKKEFWAFYVNGKFAEVGPKDYSTKDGDKIEWRIDHF